VWGLWDSLHAVPLYTRLHPRPQTAECIMLKASFYLQNLKYASNFVNLCYEFSTNRSWVYEWRGCEIVILSHRDRVHTAVTFLLFSFPVPFGSGFPKKKPFHFSHIGLHMVCLYGSLTPTCTHRYHACWPDYRITQNYILHH